MPGKPGESVLQAELAGSKDLGCMRKQQGGKGAHAYDSDPLRLGVRYAKCRRTAVLICITQYLSVTVPAAGHHLLAHAKPSASVPVWAITTEHLGCGDTLQQPPSNKDLQGGWQ